MNIILYMIFFLTGITSGYYCSLIANEIPKKLDLKRR